MPIFSDYMGKRAKNTPTKEEKHMKHVKQIKTVTAALLVALLLASCARDEATCGPGVPEQPTEITTVTSASDPLESDALAATEGTTTAPSTTRPMTTTTTHDPAAPAATATPLPDGVAEQYALADLFAQPVNRIVLKSGVTGAELTLTDTDIARVAEFCKPIRGIAPSSARGHYGYHYALTLYNGPIEVGHFYFSGATFATGYYETVNGFDYAILYHLSGRSFDEVFEFFSRYFPADTATTTAPETTVNHVWGTAQNWGELSPTSDGFDYSTLTLPDYRAINPVRYMGVDNRGMQTDGWQDFGLSGELRTPPQPIGSTYLYQTYSYFIRNDLTHLYPNDTIPSTPKELAEWLTDIGETGRRALWYSIGALPNTVELTAYEELTAEGGTVLGKATYRHSGDTWTVYLLCEEGTASVLVIEPNDTGDYVIAFTDSIARSYRGKSNG